MAATIICRQHRQASWYKVCSPPLALASCLISSFSLLLFKNSSLHREGLTCSMRTWIRLGMILPLCCSKHGPVRTSFSLDQKCINLLVQCKSYLLVDNNTYSSLCDVPHLAGAAMVHLVRHTLKQATGSERHGTHGQTDLRLDCPLCSASPTPSVQLS